MMSGDPAATKELAQLDTSFGAGEALDVEKIRVAYRSAARQLGETPRDEPALTDAEKGAGRLFPKRKAGAPAQPQGFGGGAAVDANPPLRGYYVMEARNWADGQH